EDNSEAMERKEKRRREGGEYWRRRDGGEERGEWRRRDSRTGSKERGEGRRRDDVDRRREWRGIGDNGNRRDTRDMDMRGRREWRERGEERGRRRSSRMEERRDWRRAMESEERSGRGERRFQEERRRDWRGRGMRKINEGGTERWSGRRRQEEGGWRRGDWEARRRDVEERRPTRRQEQGEERRRERSGNGERSIRQVGDRQDGQTEGIKKEGNPEFRSTVRAFLAFLKLYHCNIEMEGGRGGPPGRLVRLAAQAKRVQPGFQSVMTEQGEQKVVDSSKIEWREAWNVAVKWTRRRYKRLKEETVQQAGKLIRDLMERKQRTEIEEEKSGDETETGPQLQGMQRETESGEQQQQREREEVIPMEVEQPWEAEQSRKAPAENKKEQHQGNRAVTRIPKAKKMFGSGKGAERRPALTPFGPQGKGVDHQVVEIAEEELEDLFIEEVVEAREGSAAASRGADKGKGGGKEGSPEESRWSRHVRHEGRAGARNWSLAPVSPIVFIGDSNLSRLLKTRAWDIEVHSFPGTTITDRYTILKHRTKATVIVEQVVLAFGLNDREAGNIMSIGKILGKMVEAAREAFPEAQIRVPLVNFDQALPENAKKNLSSLNKSIEDLGCSIPMLPERDFKVEGDKVHWSLTTAEAVLRHWQGQLK
ncbi:hypothetical protein F2P79_024083, partial [Pimephales promelas]